MASKSPTRTKASSHPHVDGNGFWFDEAAADRAAGFFERFLRHVKGEWAGRPFALLPWQRDEIIRPLFGMKRPDGTRRYRTAFIEVPRKQGKSTTAAGIGLYLLFADGEPGAEIYSVAGDRDQAAIVFDLARQMVETSPALRRRARIYRRAIVVPKTASTYKVLSAEHSTKHGVNASGVVFDELHVQPTRDLWDTMVTSTGARAQPLVVAITTAGVDRESICYEQHEYARKVLDGVIEDPSYFAYIRAAPDDADWQDPATWRAANPGLGVTVSEDYLAQEAARAAEMPAYQNTFRRLHLGQWTQQYNRWIDLAVWDENAGPSFTEDELKGRSCYGGLDLGAVSDLTAWVLIFPSEADPDEISILCRFWAPEACLRNTQNRYRAQYQAWARAGFLTTTPGDAIDYAFVKTQIIEDARKFRLVDMAMDRLFQGHQLGTELTNEGLQVAGCGMGFLSMAPLTKEFERRLLARKIRHGGNPMLRWMADNVAVKMDPAGNLKPDKASSQSKIDGIVAMLLALDRAMRHRGPGSVYERRGVLVV